MIERFAPALRRLDKYPKIVTKLMLTDEFVEARRSDGAFCGLVLGLFRSDDALCGVAQRASSSRPALISTSAAAPPPRRRAAAATAPNASERATPRFSSAAIASAGGPGLVNASFGN